MTRLTLQSAIIKLTTSYMKKSNLLFVVSIIATGILAMTIPTFAHAATYAYVNTSMGVSTVTANDWVSAMANADDINIHSGVLLLTDQTVTITGAQI